MSITAKSLLSGMMLSGTTEPAAEGLPMPMRGRNSPSDSLEITLPSFLFPDLHNPLRLKIVEDLASHQPTIYLIRPPLLCSILTSSSWHTLRFYQLKYDQSSLNGATSLFSPWMAKYVHVKEAPIVADPASCFGTMRSPSSKNWRYFINAICMSWPSILRRKPALTSRNAM